MLKISLLHSRVYTWIFFYIYIGFFFKFILFAVLIFKNKHKLIHHNTLRRSMRVLSFECLYIYIAACAKNVIYVSGSIYFKYYIIRTAEDEIWLFFFHLVKWSKISFAKVIWRFYPHEIIANLYFIPFESK